MLVKVFFACALTYVIRNAGTLGIVQPPHCADFNDLTSGFAVMSFELAIGLNVRQVGRPPCRSPWSTWDGRRSGEASCRLTSNRQQ